ncbi:MAG: hypothetical protein D6696_06550, partial [Acidobacteria bacterium]
GPAGDRIAGSPAPTPPGGGRGRPAGGERGAGFLAGIDWDDPAQVERVKEFMRQRGLSDEQIEQRLQELRRRFAGGGTDAGVADPGGDPGRPGDGDGGRLRNLDLDDPAQVERVKEFMRQRGLSDDEIERRLERMRRRRAAGQG